MTLRAQRVPAQVAAMKRLLLMGLIGAGMWVVTARAQEKFSQAVRPEDWATAGLTKLSPEEWARLDALVEAYKSGVMAAARAEVAAAAAARAVAEKKAARAEAEVVATKAAAPKPAGEGFLAKAKVLLSPGTEIEYATVASRIAGDFSGWEGRAVLTLENGQRWQIANGGTYTTPVLPSPNVKIVPANLGGFWLTIEGVANRVKVLPLGAK
jgi:hypothetical protein